MLEQLLLKEFQKRFCGKT